MRRRVPAWFSLLGALLLALLAGCERGPREAALRADLQAALDGMQPDLLRLVALKPQGTAPGPGEAELTAYANLSLELARDHDFGGWGGATVGTLAATLGATARGIGGVRDGGNAAGDRLRVYASAVYERADDGWRHLGGDAPAEDAPAAAAAADPESVLARLEGILDRGLADEDTSRRQLVARGLSRALGDIERDLAAAEAGAVIAAGPVSGEYARIAAGLARIAVARDLRLAVYYSQGSVENARLVDAGQADLGLVQSDVLALAYAGETPFPRGAPLFELAALAALYPEPLHVIVPAESPVVDIADLAGRRVALGEPDSGTRLTASRVLAAHGLALSDLGAIDDGDLASASEKLVRGEVDALFATIGAPAGELRRLAARRRVRLLPLDAVVIRELLGSGRGYVQHAIAPRSYRGQREAVPTIATTAVLVARRDAAEALVDAVLRAVFFELDYESAGSLQGGLIAPATARSGLTAPLHLAAERFYAELEAANGR